MNEKNPSAVGAPAAHGPPPRGPGRGALVIAALAIAAALALGIAVGPEVRGWLAADAPDMAAEEGEGAEGTWYISQMHPWIIQPEPGQCPICGMDLVPVDPDRFAGEITIDPVIVQNIGIRVEAADRGTIERSVRTVGTVVVDEGRVHDVVQRFRGWVVETFARARFEPVAAGAPLYSVTSPEVFVAERDFLVARGGSGRTDPDLVAAARRNLELLGLPAEEIARLEESGVAHDTVVVRSPAAGIVWMKDVNPGSEVAARTVAYRVVDLSVVWVEATVYEHQLPFVRAGQDATIEIAAGEPRTLRGTVAMVYPAIDPRTRATRARIVVENPDLALEPDLYATVRILDPTSEEHVRVLSEAIVRTGTRAIVFVSLGRGRFEPRTVVPGPAGPAGRTAVLEGLAAGERVVVSGQFLLDSESRMREALAKVMRGELATEPAPAAEPGELAPVAAGPQRALADALAVYRDLHGALYRGDAAAARPLAGSLRTALERFIAAGKEADAHFAHRIAAVDDLAAAAGALGGEDLAALRVSFGDLSVALRAVVTAVGAPRDATGPWTAMQCGMAEGIAEDGVWLQIGDDVRNPYFGEASGMRSCAMETAALPVAPDGGQR